MKLNKYISELIMNSVFLNKLNALAKLFVHHNGSSQSLDSMMNLLFCIFNASYNFFR